ncbi:prostaglandin f synthase, partial [Strigomonas culicis]
MSSPSIVLSNGVNMPQVGIGMWQTPDGETATKAVQWAVDAGYRHIDTAMVYRNEEGVGAGVKACGVPREELFITTKLWNDDHGYETTLKAFEDSRKRLGVDYVDLYLIHWPGQQKTFIDTWRAFEKLYEEKKVRAIGVSNFEEEHLEELLAVCKVAPMVNQVEMHPDFQRPELRAYCAKKGIVVTGWRPLGKGSMLEMPIIVKLAEKHKCAPAQVIIRWFVQLGVVVIPKSANEERIKANFDVFGFQLDEEDMQAMKSLDENKRMGFDPN